MFIFRRQLRNLHFFQNCGHFQNNISCHQNKVSWCYIENDHNFERNEDCATVFLKRTDFNKMFQNSIPYTHHFNQRPVYFLNPFLKTISLLLRLRLSYLFLLKSSFYSRVVMKHKWRILESQISATLFHSHKFGSQEEDQK